MLLLLLLLRLSAREKCVAEAGDDVSAREANNCRRRCCLVGAKIGPREKNPRQPDWSGCNGFLNNLDAQNNNK